MKCHIWALSPRYDGYDYINLISIRHNELSMWDVYSTLVMVNLKRVIYSHIMIQSYFGKLWNKISPPCLTTIQKPWQFMKQIKNVYGWHLLSITFERLFFLPLYKNVSKLSYWNHVSKIYLQGCCLFRRLVYKSAHTQRSNVMPWRCVNILCSFFLEGNIIYNGHPMESDVLWILNVDVVITSLIILHFSMINS